MSYYMYIHDFLELVKKYDQHKIQRELMIVGCDNTLDNCSMYSRSPNMQDSDESARLNELIRQHLIDYYDIEDNCEVMKYHFNLKDMTSCTTSGITTPSLWCSQIFTEASSSNISKR